MHAHDQILAYNRMKPIETHYRRFTIPYFPRHYQPLQIMIPKLHQHYVNYVKEHHHTVYSIHLQVVDPFVLIIPSDYSQRKTEQATDEHTVFKHFNIAVKLPSFYGPFERVFGFVSHHGKKDFIRVKTMSIILGGSGNR